MTWRLGGAVYRLVFAPDGPRCELKVGLRLLGVCETRLENVPIALVTVYEWRRSAKPRARAELPLLPELGRFSERFKKTDTLLVHRRLLVLERARTGLRSLVSGLYSRQELYSGVRS